MRNTSKIIGREGELREFKSLLDRKSAGLAVVRGRRRVGKSRLIKEKGILFDEFEPIFHELFSSRSKIYKNILLEMCGKSLFLQDIYLGVASAIYLDRFFFHVTNFSNMLM